MKLSLINHLTSNFFPSWKGIPKPKNIFACFYPQKCISYYPFQSCSNQNTPFYLVPKEAIIVHDLLFS